MPRRTPPPLKPVPQAGDEYGRRPVYGNGIYEATTGPREVAEFLGPPSQVVTPKHE